MNEMEIAGYLDRGLSDADRDRIEDHLVDCSECRHNVAEAQQLIQRVRRPRRFAAIGGLLAIAAVALFVVRPQFSNHEVPLERSASSESAPLVAYGPLGETVQIPVRFVWSSAPDAVSYRVTLSSAEGATVWSESRADTTAILPDSVTLRPGARYTWVTDAILSDGSTRSTGLRDFGPVR